jgi:hypothetical protein
LRRALLSSCEQKFAAGMPTSDRASSASLVAQY